ncbi:MAG: hypothetical protein JXQ81_09335, partial [Desulfuromonadales bacterium]|nr:hypothetical protein [Desulfuromonadales bacterium]
PTQSMGPVSPGKHLPLPFSHGEIDQIVTKLPEAFREQSRLGFRCFNLAAGKKPVPQKSCLQGICFRLQQNAIAGSGYCPLNRIYLEGQRTFTGGGIMLIVQIGRNIRPEGEFKGERQGLQLSRGILFRQQGDRYCGEMATEISVDLLPGATATG